MSGTLSVAQCVYLPIVCSGYDERYLMYWVLTVWRGKQTNAEIKQSMFEIVELTFIKSMLDYVFSQCISIIAIDAENKVIMSYKSHYILVLSYLI